MVQRAIGGFTHKDRMPKSNIEKTKTKQELKSDATLRRKRDLGSERASKVTQSKGELCMPR
jgi:hypothetical protein